MIGANGNSIFLLGGSYWFSKLNPFYTNLAGWFVVGSSGNSTTYADRYIGFTIRPVTSNSNAGGDTTDHSQDHLVTDKVKASFLGGAYSSINGKIQSGSQLNVRFSNGSSEAVTLTKIQLGDAATGSEGNNMLNSEVEVAAGEAKGYTVTVGAGGLTTPVIRFTYRYNNKNYVAEATWNL